MNGDPLYYLTFLKYKTTIKVKCHNKKKEKKTVEENTERKHAR